MQLTLIMLGQSFDDDDDEEEEIRLPLDLSSIRHFFLFQHFICNQTYDEVNKH